MATAITSHTIGSDLKCDPDAIWEGTHLGSTATITSDAFLLGGVAGGVEIKVVCETGFTLPQAEDLVMVLQTSATLAGTYAAYTEVVITGATGDTVFAVGDEIFRLIPDKEMVDQIYSKLTITTASDLSAGAVDAYFVAVTR